MYTDVKILTKYYKIEFGNTLKKVFQGFIKVYSRDARLVHYFKTSM